MRKTIALVAHDAQKMSMAEWANYNKEELSRYTLIGTSGTAKVVQNVAGLAVTPVGHGPDGADLELAVAVLHGDVDAVVFFIDVTTPLAHESDIQAFIRTCVLHQTPLALNRATADYLISSRLLE